MEFERPIHAKINWALVGAQHMEFSHWLINCYVWLACSTLWHACDYSVFVH